jgi:hypothetical protein
MADKSDEEIEQEAQAKQKDVYETKSFKLSEEKEDN